MPADHDALLFCCHRLYYLGDTAAWVLDRVTQGSITLVTVASGVIGRTKARTWSKLLGGAGPAGALVKGL